MKQRLVVGLSMVAGMAIGGGVAATMCRDPAREHELDKLRELRDEVCWSKAPEYVKTACEIAARP